ncbi:hypothetical protein [Microbacterium sp. 10M-3C3]|uniref:hypothetical protein n=1 Tax=Microbacterium sp. 10M-3C3 TaxID=2483401 RepID=UPI000F642321|nr:hypothetical protein [Microbacterium sp. 10M-3C3]
MAASVALAGCAGQAPGDLGRLQAELASCPDRPVNVYDAVDGSGTTQSDTIAREYVAAIEADVEKTAVCGGHISIVAFGTNSVTAPIFEGDLEAPGSTDIAKLRRVPGIVDEVMAEVTKNYKPAIALLPSGGTDVTGLLRLLDEAQELRPDMALQATIYTDGLTNQGIVIDHTLTEAEATALADTVAVPDLSGASVSVMGIGRTTGDPLPSDFIAGLKAFYTRLCTNTGAAKCLVVTDGR